MWATSGAHRGWPEPEESLNSSCGSAEELNVSSLEPGHILVNARGRVRIVRSRTGTGDGWNCTDGAPISDAEAENTGLWTVYTPDGLAAALEVAKQVASLSELGSGQLQSGLGGGASVPIGDAAHLVAGGGRVTGGAEESGPTQADEPARIPLPSGGIGTGQKGGGHIRTPRPRGAPGQRQNRVHPRSGLTLGKEPVDPVRRPGAIIELDPPLHPLEGSVQPHFLRHGAGPIQVPPPRRHLAGGEQDPGAP